jgi:hypothetical protein
MIIIYRRASDQLSCVARTKKTYINHALKVQFERLVLLDYRDGTFNTCETSCLGQLAVGDRSKLNRQRWNLKVKDNETFNNKALMLPCQFPRCSFLQLGE